jgi:hypothetical protein
MSLIAVKQRYFLLAQVGQLMCAGVRPVGLVEAFF